MIDSIKRFYRYQLRLLFLLLMLSPTLLLTACVESSSDQEVTTEEVVRPARIYTVESFHAGGTRNFPAIIEANKKSDLSFRVSGQLIKVPLKSGVEVKEGALLAEIDDTDYKNTLADRRAKYKLAKTQYDQTMKLFKQKYVPQSQVDEASAELKAAEVAVTQARTNLKYCKLYAPFSGMLAHIDVENHQLIQAQQTILELQNTTQLDVQFDVPESLIKATKTGEGYKSLCGDIKMDSSKGKSEVYKACYKEHDSVPDTQTRTYPVLFSLKNPEQTNLLPGMSVEVVLDLSKLMKADTTNSVAIPVEAVFDEEQQQWVWTLDKDMRTVKTKVTVKGIQDGKIRITDGLSEGDKVVTAGVSHLIAGQKIRAFVKERGL